MSATDALPRHGFPRAEALVTVLVNPPSGRSADDPAAGKGADADAGAVPALGGISVNGVTVPEREILAEAQNHPSETPGSALRAAAEALVVRELLWQETRRLDIPAVPDLDDAGRPETERDAGIRILIEREVSVPSATLEECQRYYERHPGKFRAPTLYEARHILIAVPESDSADRRAARTRAQGLCGALAERPELFRDLARDHSDCPSCEQGGNLGQLSPGSTVAEFEAALANMHEGDITPAPVESRFGFHVIALDRRIEGHDLPFDLVSDRIAAWLEASAWSKAVSQYISILAGKAEICGISLGGAEGPLVQ